MKTDVSLTNFTHQPRKRFGQNFLVDDSVISNIVLAIAPQPADVIIEIGPGKGALTLPLLAKCPSLTLIELDRDLIGNLQQLREQYPLLTILQADALTVNFAELSGGKLARVVGNLPYNISTPLIFHLLQYRSIIKDMHFMLQKEVVDRMDAQPNSKAYGRLSVMVQYHAAVDKLFNVPSTSFSPAPKVTSAVVRLTPYTDLPHVARDEALLARVVSTCFQMRRKTMRNSLRKLCDDDLIAKLPIDSSRRPEDLSVGEFVDLSNAIYQQGENP